MTDAKCPFCGEQESEYCFSERGHDLVACQNCELFFIDPYGTDVHDKVLTYDYDHLDIVDPETHHVSSTNFYKNKYLSLISEECANAQSILDVGCGTGALLTLLSNGYPEIERYGVELNTARAEFAEQKSGCKIYQVPIEEFSFDRTFDVITLVNVLSHIPSIDGLFSSLKRLLSKNGRLVIVAGEMSQSVRKDAVNDWSIPDHMHFLGLGTINHICEKYGFEIQRQDRTPYSEELISRTRMLSPGRSAARNIAKRVIAYTPSAMWVLRRLYEIRHTAPFYTSFIVLSHAD